MPRSTMPLHILECPYNDWLLPEVGEIVRSRQDVEVKVSSCKRVLVDALRAADEKAVLHFMDFPPEIRLRVYRFVILQRRTIRRYPQSSPGQHHGRCSRGRYGRGITCIPGPAYWRWPCGPYRRFSLAHVSSLIRAEFTQVMRQNRRHPFLEKTFEMAQRQHNSRPVGSKLAFSKWIERADAEAFSDMSSFALYLVQGRPTIQQAFEREAHDWHFHIDFTRKDSSFKITLFNRSRHDHLNDKPLQRSQLLQGGFLARCWTTLHAGLTSICADRGVGHFDKDDLKRVVTAALTAM